MSAIAEKIRAEHRLDTVQGCICGTKHTGGKGWWSKHIATVTEAAVRAQIAAEIRSVRNGGLGDYALGRAADIAEGGAS